MKYLILIASLLPVITNAQNCKINKETDPYTKEVKVSTGFIQLAGGSLTIDADSKEIDFFFTIDGANKCFDDKSTAAIFFDGSKMKIVNRNNGSMNCEGFFHFIFKNTASPVSLVRKFTTQKVTSLMFPTTDKKEITINFNPTDQQILMDLANCLVTEARALIK